MADLPGLQKRGVGHAIFEESLFCKGSRGESCLVVNYQLVEIRRRLNITCRFVILLTPTQIRASLQKAGYYLPVRNITYTTQIQDITYWFVILLTPTQIRDITYRFVILLTPMQIRDITYWFVILLTPMQIRASLQKAGYYLPVRTSLTKSEYYLHQHKFGPVFRRQDLCSG